MFPRGASTIATTSLQVAQDFARRIPNLFGKRTFTINTTARYAFLVLGVILSLHLVLSLTHEQYGRITTFSNAAHPNTRTHELSLPTATPQPIPVALPNIMLPTTSRRANATFVILARNSDVNGAVKSIREIEDRFNQYYAYPYVFLNEEEFTEDFKNRVSVLTTSTVEFGLIPRDHWFQPEWIDEEKATVNRNKLTANHVIYGGSVSYRNMCRFNSGFFFRHPLLEKYRWYWRIEPDVHFHCDMHYDPFLFMEENNKTYGFTIALMEYWQTIPTLWTTTKKFMAEHPEYIPEENAMKFISDNGRSYNLCHFWSNFEIADLDFWRSPAYMAYFEYLDTAGGFYYERWGDAPVHSIAASIFLNRDQIHFFDDIGYEHKPFTHCPSSKTQWWAQRCSCDPKKSFDYTPYSCLKKWDALIGRKILGKPTQ